MLVKVQKLGEDLVIIIPAEICQKLNIKEGCQVDMEPLICGSEIGLRIKIKN